MRRFLTSPILLAAAGLCAISTFVPVDAHAEDAKLFITSSLPIILGEVETISLVIEVPETHESEGRPLQVTASVGKIDTPERVGPGKYRAHYHLPSTKFPQAAILAVWQETGPDARIDFLRIPLSARTKLPVKANAGNEVRVLVGDEKFGPVNADRKGSALVPIVVPPGVREVVVETTDRSAGKKRSNVPVKVPPYNRLAMAVTPYLTDGKMPVMVYVYYDDDKTPPTADKVKVTAPAGTVIAQPPSGNLYLYKYMPAPVTAKGQVEISAVVTGDDSSRAKAQLLLGNPAPERILSRTAPSSLMANGEATKVLRALLIDHYGLGVPGVPMRATASDGTVGGVTDVGGGYYEVTLTAPSTVPKGKKVTVDLTAAALGSAPISGQIEVSIAGQGTPKAPTVVAETPAAPRKISSATIGARIGGSFDSQIAPLLGLEFSVRPRWGEQRRAAFFLSVEFRTMSREATVPTDLKIDSSLMRLPIMVGLTYDVAVKNDWRGYLGVGGGIAGVAHRIETNFQEPQVFRRVAPVAEVLAGLAYSGLFLEVAGTYMSLSDRALEVPSIGVSASLGYRLGIF